MKYVKKGNVLLESLLLLIVVVMIVSLLSVNRVKTDIFWEQIIEKSEHNN